MFNESDYPHGINKDKIIELIQNENPKVLIELGAEDGSDTLSIVNKLGDDDTYIVLEADPRNIKRFRVPHDKRLTLINAAISNKDGFGKFNICTGLIPSLQRPHYQGSSTRLPTKETYDECPWLKYEQIEVPYITLDTIMNKYQLNKIDFIWCDVEGATEEVIEGGLNALKMTKYFYTEVKSERTYAYEGELMYEGILEKMKSIGFELVFKFKDDALFRNLSYGP